MLTPYLGWCVDNESKFVLQIRPPQYWRIEVPNATTEELSRVEDLKEVLGHILRFEKTPCPFQRDFTVDLPELPKTPVKKIPWKPIERTRREASPLSERNKHRASMDIDLLGQDLESSPTLSRRHSLAPTRSALNIPETLEELRTPITRPGAVSQPSVQELRTVFAHPHDIGYGSPKPSPLGRHVDLEVLTEALEFLPLESPPEEPSVEDYPVLVEDSDNFSDATDDTNATPKNHFQPEFQPLVFDLGSDEKHSSLQNYSRSVTAPPALSLITSSPSKSMKKDSKSPLRQSPMNGSGSDFSSSVESFHSVQSWHSPLAPPSPPASGPSSPTAYPYPHDNIVLPKKAHHSRDVSEQTATLEIPNAWDSAEMSPKAAEIPYLPQPDTSSASSSPEPKKKSKLPDPIDTSSTIRHRATTSSNSRRRALSPMPPAVNLFSPQTRRPRRLQTSRHLPTAILQKTCEILLSPPSHLFHLMMNIASRIAAGEWRGIISGYGEAVHWDFQDEYGREGWEDDYGIALPNLPKTTRSRGNSENSSSGGSWEVDWTIFA